MTPQVGCAVSVWLSPTSDDGASNAPRVATSMGLGMWMDWLAGHMVRQQQPCCHACASVHMIKKSYERSVCVLVSV